MWNLRCIATRTMWFHVSMTIVIWNGCQVEQFQNWNKKFVVCFLIGSRRPQFWTPVFYYRFCAGNLFLPRNSIVVTWLLGIRKCFIKKKNTRFFLFSIHFSHPIALGMWCKYKRTFILALEDHRVRQSPSLRMHVVSCVAPLHNLHQNNSHTSVCDEED